MVDKVERKWLWGFALVVMVITTLPYLIGYSRQGADWRYTGMVFGAEDGNSYIAKMLRGANGDWLFRTPYSPYPQRGALVYFPFIFLGKLTAPPGQHEQLVGVYHLFRLAGILLYVFAAYDFIAIFVRETRWRRLGVALATLGGGMGWLQILGFGSLWGKGMPLEYYSPETFGFLMIYGLPHLACARAFLLWGLRDYLLPGAPVPGWKTGLRTALLWFGVGIMQPLTVVAGWAVICTHIAASGLGQAWQSRFSRKTDWKEWWWYFWRALRTGLLSAPMVVYTIMAFRFDPFLKGWEGQNTILSPQFTHYLLAYGMILPLAILGAGPLLREFKLKGWLVLGWVIVFPLLAYAPYSLQRRLPEGVWVAMIILFLKWVEVGSAAAQRWAPRWAFLSFITTIFLVAGGIMAAWSPRAPIFVPVGAVRAFNSMGQIASTRNSAGEAIVLASFDTSNPLPAWVEVRTVTGHGPEGVDGIALRKRVQCFYQVDCSERDRTALLRGLGVDYVLWGPNERRLGKWDPRGAPYLEPVYQEGDYFIFAVQKTW
jgi:hypothetical protein